MITSPIRVLFMGTPEFAVPTFRALCEQSDTFSVVAAITQPDKPAGRGRRLTPSAVKACAQHYGVPVHTPTKLKAEGTRQTLADAAADVFVVAAYGRILPRQLLDLPPAGCINVHASLLPRHRGASPIAHAITSGDRETGVSIMRMAEGLDTGPVYEQRAVAIGADDTCGSLTRTLSELGAKLLVETLPAIVSGQLEPTAQDDSASTYAPLLRKEDGWLTFNRSAAELSRLVRGFSPWPGATAAIGQTRLQVLRASAELNSLTPDGAEGQVVRADGTGVWVRCCDGLLRLDEVKPAGKRAMAAAAWVAGRGVKVGDRFAPPPPNPTASNPTAPNPKP